MSTTPIRIALCALLAWGLVAQPATSKDDIPDSDVTDRHEIPAFVLKRTELATDVDTSASVATSTAVIR